MKYENCPVCADREAPETTACPLCDMREVVDGMREAEAGFPDCIGLALLAVKMAFPDTDLKASLQAEPLVQH